MTARTNAVGVPPGVTITDVDASFFFIEPTVVDLASFTVEVEEDGNQIAWTTSFEEKFGEIFISIARFCVSIRI